MTEGIKSARLGLVLLVGLSTGWGFNWPALKIALAEIPLWQFRGVTILIAAACLLALARVAGQRIAVPRDQWTILLLASLINITSWHVLVAYGVRMSPYAGQASILAFTMPVWAALLGVVFLKERMTWRRGLSLVLGCGAIALLLAQDVAALGASPLGAILVLLAAFSWAIGTLILKHVSWRLQSLALAGWQLLIGAVPVVIIALATERFTMHQASVAALTASAYLTAIPLVFCYYAWFRVVTIFPTSIASIGTLMVPVIALFSSALVLGDPIGWRQLAALLLVVTALALVLIQPKGSATAPRPKADADAEPAR